MFGLWGLMVKQMPPNKQFLEILHVYDKNIASNRSFYMKFESNVKISPNNISVSLTRLSVYWVLIFHLSQSSYLMLR